jgi:prepilin-type N-terminal cleavage/methylation domain-containing protein
MLQKLQKRNSEEGFTIIEVLIVLAIAGLILLIVFLAVPALQRNARNTSRKNDVSSLASAVSEFVNNNDGQNPAAKSDFINNWKPGYYSAANVTFKANAGAVVTPDPGDVNKIDVYTYSTCNGEVSASANATPRSIAITYDVETGGGMMEQCVTAQ